MYISQEMRWFSSGKDASIMRWFLLHGLDPDHAIPRTDFYVPQTDSIETGIKMREGKIEIKIRKSSPLIKELTPTVIGFSEQWIKWSMVAEASDPVVAEITSEKKSGWWEMEKKRVGVKLVRDSSGKISILKITDKIPGGCQVEYTSLEFQGKRWYSFAIESFGNTEASPADDYFAAMLDGVVLSSGDSMGYPEFLKREIIRQKAGGSRQ